jgi:hypothetical protein
VVDLMERVLDDSMTRLAPPSPFMSGELRHIPTHEQVLCFSRPQIDLEPVIIMLMASAFLVIGIQIHRRTRNL